MPVLLQWSRRSGNSSKNRLSVSLFFVLFGGGGGEGMVGSRTADAEMKTFLASCQGHMSMFQRGVGEGERRRQRRGSVRDCHGRSRQDRRHGKCEGTISWNNRLA